ncbi:Cof-type HAD-IIB family hydrolase [Vibrio hippocampi]|uniref:Sugar phosphatase YidA n=1 Tax=Vibrio hippocampi TaxID=654686 RepID=A0ABN8DGZ2_9VIBR|nr:Cof-type HAD-IIB family hydrolase [Vibrio hippocampi]CAH0525901.1 Sugar phosphatase YidA [Vibrio hippocampi]
MYKLIAIDLDGTLLTSDKQISPRTQEALLSAKQQGVQVLLASGRPLKGMLPYLQQLGLITDQDYVVHSNGCFVANVGSGEVIHQQLISGADAKKVAVLAKQLGLDCHAFSTELGLITPKTNPYTQLEAKINNLEINEYDFAQLEDDHRIIKAMIVAAPEDLAKAAPLVPQSFKDDYTVVQSSPYFLEFINPATNKGQGVQVVADRLNVAQSEVICFGDAENDHHMIEWAGLGIAMDNAMPQTKALADELTDNNNADGVAKGVERHVLNVIEKQNFA